MDTDFLLKMDRNQLEKLSSDIKAQFKKLEAQRKKDALAAVKRIEEEYGYSLNELKAGKRTKGAPKYAHPEDPDATWTGRGRKPQWVVEHLEEGKSLSDLEI